MVENQANVNFKNMPNVAPLPNVSLCVGGLQKAIERPTHLPGFVVFYGPSGYGKSLAASVARTVYNAYLVQARSSWTRKAAHEAILKEMGIKPASTLAVMADQVAEQLVLSSRPLIIDEADFLVEKGSIEIVRDIYEASLAPVMLIGEENLPSKLKKYERFHGRVLEFLPAQPASYEDALSLRDLYAKKIQISDDLMELVFKQAHGSLRRIVVNIERIQDSALAEGKSEMDAVSWGGKSLFTGEAPSRR